MRLEDKHNFRKRLISYALMHGIKPAAREYRCSANTVRLWLRRFQVGGNKGLEDRSRAPRSCPHKVSSEVEQLVIKCRNKSPAFGPVRLKDYFDIAYIDADHRIPAVLADIALWLPLVRKGGIICGHDFIKYKNYGVIEAVDKMFGLDNVNIIKIKDRFNNRVWIKEL